MEKKQSTPLSKGDQSVVSSGSEVLDELLNGGYEKEVITTVYGPGGSGKTNLCLLLCKSVAEQGKKIIYIDTEGNFSNTRLKQLCEKPDVMEKIKVLKPTNFKEQREALKKLTDDDLTGVGAVVIDSIAVFYRLGAYENDVQIINKELVQQLSLINEICRKKNIPVLITNQVYSSFENKNDVKMVGGDILNYGSKCLIELKKFHKGQRGALLIKHRSIEEGKQVMFEIKEKGIYKIK